MKKWFLFLALGFIAVLLAGCATYVERVSPFSEESDGMIYPATRLDVAVVAAAYEITDLDIRYLVPLSVIDMAPSVVTDTIFLPVDLFNQARWGRKGAL